MANFQQQIDEYKAGTRNAISCVQTEPYWPAISADEFDLLIDTITENPHLKSLQINNTCLGPERMQRLVAALERQPDFTSLSFPFNKFPAETVQEVVGFASRCHQLSKLELRGTHSDSETLKLMEAALADKANHRNLVFTMPTNQKLRAFTEENAARASEYQQQIITGGLKNAAPSLLWEIEQLRGAVLSNHELAQEKYDAFVQTLPVLASGTAPDIESLLQPDANGYTPLDNPKTWRTHPDLLQQLAKKGELDSETLYQRTPKGPTVAEYAFGHGDTAAALNTLLENNISLIEALRPQGNSPSAIMDIAAKKGELPQLFTPEIWKQSTRGELSAALATLPEDAQAQIPNRHQLLAGKPHHHQQAWAKG